MWMSTRQHKNFTMKPRDLVFIVETTKLNIAKVFLHATGFRPNCPRTKKVSILKSTDGNKGPMHIMSSGQKTLNTAFEVLVN